MKVTDISDEMVQTAIGVFYATAYTDDIRMRYALVAALAVAPRELPTREEIARGLHAAFSAAFGPGISSFEALAERPKNAVFAEADYVLSIISQHAPAQGVAWTRELSDQLANELRCKKVSWRDLDGVLFECGRIVFGDPTCPAPAQGAFEVTEGEMREALGFTYRNDDYSGVDARRLNAVLAKRPTCPAPAAAVDMVASAKYWREQCAKAEAERDTALQQLAQSHKCVELVERERDEARQNLEGRLSNLKAVATELGVTPVGWNRLPGHVADVLKRAEKAEAELNALQQRHARLVEDVRAAMSFRMTESAERILDGALAAETKQAEPEPQNSLGAAFDAAHKAFADVDEASLFEAMEQAEPFDLDDHCAPEEAARRVKGAASFVAKMAEPKQAEPVQRDESTPEGKAFWAAAKAAAQSVATWPDWKRAGVNVATERSEPTELINRMWGCDPGARDPWAPEPAQPSPVSQTDEELDAEVDALVASKRSGKRVLLPSPVSLAELQAQVARHEYSLRLLLTTIVMLEADSDEASKRFNAAYSALDAKDPSP